MSDHELPDEDANGSDDLLSALEIIEDQPLSDRASGYLRLHDELARRLDASA
jgi:hypothetical protein